MPTTPLERLDDRGHRRLFAMLSLLAAGDPMPRAELLRRAERLVPLSVDETARIPESAQADSAQDRRAVDRSLTRAYETLRARKLMVDPPQDSKWALTDEGRRLIAEADGSYEQFWNLTASDGEVTSADDGPEEVSVYPEPVETTTILGALNQILYGPPGTGKTYSTVDAALIALDHSDKPAYIGEPTTDEVRRTRVKAYRTYVEDELIEFVTFHQAFSYEDFVEGFRPRTNDGQIAYSVEWGIFGRLVDRARRSPSKKYVLVIDEINRGNVAGIFGELITLIEDGKRLGQAEAMEVILPYSNRPFGVPNNLHIIGTMNTADRSLAGVDLALRRRFDFVEMPPRPDLLDGVVVDGVNLAHLLKALNERIQSAKGREFAIGHAFFMPLTGIEDPVAIADLRGIFERKVLPLLQEYFFEDDEQIAAVLGQQRRARGATSPAWDYLRPRSDAATVANGSDIWDPEPKALDEIEFYRQVAGMAPRTQQDPGQTGSATASGSGTSEGGDAEVAASSSDA